MHCREGGDFVPYKGRSKVELIGISQIHRWVRRQTYEMDNDESLENFEGDYRVEKMKTPKRSVACHRCHAQKSKCSGERPCSRCRKAGCASQCRYAARDRKVKVEESYLEQLIRDSQELHARRDKPKRPNLSESEPWFQTDGPSTLPIYINEAACIAFATRVCQRLTPKDPSGSVLKSRIPRRNYTDEPTLKSLAQVDTPWPNLACAQLLVKTALGHINPAFHLVLNKEVIDGLLWVYRSENFDDPIIKCKYFALFAIGQVYSSKSNSSSPQIVPGTDYFARALSLIHIIPERPTMAHLESLLLLAYFCQFLNRFHSAYLLIGNALRLGLSIGLNYNVPQSQNLGPLAIEREHRVRIWWSIYILDRFWGSKSGFPVQIHDDDIYVDLPSSQASQSFSEYFSESSYQTATVELAKITGRTTRDIYTPRKSSDSLLQREHKLLIQLRHLINTLPENLRLHTDRPNPKHTVLLHLQFSYCVMTALRPVLLYFLDRDYSGRQNERIELLDKESREMLTTLSTACIHAARYSLKLCLDEWTRGSLATFGYAFPAFLFSSALILIISSVSPLGSRCDLTASETATEMLKVLSASDNLAAKDLYEHLMKVRQCLDTSQLLSSSTGEHNASSRPVVSPELSGSLVAQEPLPCEPPSLEATTFTGDLDHFPPSYFPPDADEGGFATESILESSPMQDFLNKSTSDVGLLMLPEMPNDFDTAFLCFGDHPVSDNLV